MGLSNSLWNMVILFFAKAWKKAWSLKPKAWSLNFKFGPRPEPDPSLKIQSPKGLKLEKIWPDPPLLDIKPIFNLSHYRPNYHKLLTSSQLSALAMYRPNYHPFSTSSQLSTLAIYRPSYHKFWTSSQLSALAMYRPKYNQFKPTFNFNHAPPILNFKPCTAPITTHSWLQASFQLYP